MKNKKMYKILLICLLVLSVTLLVVLGYILNKKYEWVSFKLFEKKEVITVTWFEDAEVFSEGLAAVKIDGKWGYINANGELMIKNYYYDATSFHNGTAKVRLDESVGTRFINKSAEYIYGLHYSENLINEYRDEPFCIDKYNIVMSLDKVGCIDEDGELIIPMIYNSFYEYDKWYENDMVLAETDDLYQIFDKEGNIIFTIYKTSGQPYIAERNGNVVGYYIPGDGYDKTGGGTIYNLKGEVVSKYDYDYIYYANNGMYIGGRNNRDYLINYNGNELKNLTEYNAVIEGFELYYLNHGGIYFNDEFSVIFNEEEDYEYKAGVMDDNGNLVIPFEYTYIEHITDDKFIARKNNKYGVIDSNNKIIIPFKYDDLHSIVKHNDDYTENTFYALAFGNDEKYGLMDMDENILIEQNYSMLPCEADFCTPFYLENITELIYAAKDLKMGVIDKDEKVIIPFEYDMIYTQTLGENEKVFVTGVYGYDEIQTEYYDFNGNKITDKKLLDFYKENYMYEYSEDETEYILVRDYENGLSAFYKDGEFLEVKYTK